MIKLLMIALLFASTSCSSAQDESRTNNATTTHTNAAVLLPLAPDTNEPALVAFMTVDVPSGGPTGPQPLQHVVHCAVWPDGTELEWDPQSSKYSRIVLSRAQVAEVIAIVAAAKLSRVGTAESIHSGFGPHSACEVVVMRSGTNRFNVSSEVPRGARVNDAADLGRVLIDACKPYRAESSPNLLQWTPHLSLVD